MGVWGQSSVVEAIIPWWKQSSRGENLNARSALRASLATSPGERSEPLNHRPPKEGINSEGCGDGRLFAKQKTTVSTRESSPHGSVQHLPNIIKYGPN